MVRSVFVSLVAALTLSVATLAAPAEVVVVNEPAKPVPVSINETQPFQAAAGTTQLSGNAGSLTLATVPAGKRLVIEYVSAGGQVPPGQFVELFNISTATDFNGTVVHDLIVLSQPPAFNGDSVARACQQLRLYASSGTTVRVFFRRSSPAGTASFHATISGYLVDE